MNTNDVFVLKTPKALMLWVGKGGTPEEKEAAKYVAGMLGGTATEVQETKEPGECCSQSSELWRITVFNSSSGQLPFLLAASWFLECPGWEEGLPDLQDPAGISQGSSTVQLLKQDWQADSEHSIFPHFWLIK